MLKARSENKSPANNQTASEVSSHDNIESELLTTLSQINPKKLESISHSKYISRLSKTLTYCMDHDYSKLLLFVQAIKDCGKPCYKRDALIETLHNTFFVQQDETVLLKILCDISRDNRDFMPWKEMANVIVTLPDLIANCGLIDRYLEFVPKSFYCIILEIIHKSLLSYVDNNKDSTFREEVALFYAHLIGRVAIAGFRTLVWSKFTSRLVPDDSAPLRSLVSSILGILIRVADFEIFIESLYGPIFYHMRPTPTNGEIIESIIGDSLLHNETLQYIVCKKYILQTNFNQDRHRQNLILYNIFSYLSRLASNNKSTMAAAATTSTRETSSSVYDGDRLDTETEQGSTILINTLLEVAKSWSNGTKILLRPYDHNRYIGCAMVMALKFMMRKEHQQSLLKRADEIQTEVIRGLQIYLNRSSSDVRNIAMCVAEILLTRLHDLIDAEVGKDLAKKRVPLELNVEWDESCLAIKSMFQLDIVTFCKELDSNIDSHDETRDDITVPRMNRQQSQHRHESTAPVEQAVSDDASDKDDDHDIEHDDESMDAPIYLNDCISGLIDNNKPRYVKLCLSKVVELIRQLSKQQEENDQKQGKVKNDTLKKSTTNDAIRDVAIELAQVLLYLEDQYSLDDFDALQRSALVSLTVAAPDLVAKYLLDELNNQSKNIRHQAIILQTLIESAQRLGNRFTKYGALYFYGMVHQLKISTLAPSSISIVSAVKSLKADQLVTSDDSYLLNRVLLSVSLIIKCLNQQLITCKLSNDLLDILAAYRHHPDSGVRKAIVACLTVIRDCTPAVYFREHLNDRTVQLFGAWLAIESEFMREDNADTHARSTHLT